MTLIYNIHYEVAAAAFATILFLYVRMFYGTDKKSSMAFQRLIVVLVASEILRVRADPVVLEDPPTGSDPGVWERPRCPSFSPLCCLTERGDISLSVCISWC